MNVGIDDMALYVPNLYMDIKDLAEKRDIPFEKLSRGLGLQEMALPDAFEDAATMAANAILELIQKNNIKPQDIGRIYLGTESALDGSKPTITYSIEMLVELLKDEHGEDCFDHCDVVDMTFACIGGVDALQNTIDWIRSNPNECGIVVCSDFAKYELESTGEYTQGAGAIAMLVKKNPRLVVIEPTWGIATKAVHDFYKPQRRFKKSELFKELVNGISDQYDIDLILESIEKSFSENSHHLMPNRDVILHKETPIFDGQYSNACYKNRIIEAYNHFNQKLPIGKRSVESWERIVFHLPYAFHGKRIFTQVYAEELLKADEWNRFKSENNIEDLEGGRSVEIEKNAKAISKSQAYRAFVEEKIEKGQRASSRVGNLYTGSIFLSLMSVLESDLKDGVALENKLLGFFAYGSGSKSKVFEARVIPGWEKVVEGFEVFKKLDQRTAISYDEYIKLHTENLDANLKKKSTGFFFTHYDMEENREFARNYCYSAD